MTIGLLISGNLGLVILNKLLQNNDVSVQFVFTDSRSTSIIEACKSKNIKYFAGNPRNGKANVFLNKLESPNLILSVNYLFIIEEDIIKKASQFAINLHGSLLPKYRGRTPHVWAIINNEKVTGITAHLIEKGCDEGDIVMQEEIPIMESYSGQDLLNIFNERYPLMVNELIFKIKSNSIYPIKQDHLLATYFEKRTSDDGKIDFNWQKERIYNWVRAQAKPYPGAFCFSGTSKIIIHKIEFSNLGFTQQMPNGLIIDSKDNTIFIKVPNGVLKVLEMQAEIQINKGEILS